ncbi:hypothetical protein L484_005200 [Morus notabilis]|uniref:Uncharacterized protein n=1 Tax=Morus notabilis TaxID=981085 RepID=W9R937_9ROSA|nr:hypothetical protein L484_005200 [Morus notabilis]
MISMQKRHHFLSSDWKKLGKCLDCGSCKVKRCGVRMLYMKDAEEMGIVANNEQYVACESNATMVEPAEPSGVEIDLNIKNNWESCSFDLSLNSYESSFVGQEVDTSLSSNHFKEEHASADNPGPITVTDFFDSETDEPHLKRAKFFDYLLTLSPR